MENLIDVNEAAKILRVHHHTVLRYCERRMLPHVQLGKRKMFRASTLEKWMSERELESVSPFAAAKKGAK